MLEFLPFNAVWCSSMEVEGCSGNILFVKIQGVRFLDILADYVLERLGLPLQGHALDVLSQCNKLVTALRFDSAFHIDAER